MVPVSAEEKKNILALEDWRSSLNEENLFVNISAPGFKDGALAKRADKSCVFLDRDNLCLIHKKYGFEAKPSACQLFPYILTPFDKEFRVSLRFDCSGVCQSSPGKLNDNMKDLRRLTKLIYPNGITEPIAQQSVPSIYGKVRLPADKFNKINEAILAKICQFKLPVRKLLIWLVMFANHASQVKWNAVEGNDFDGLLNLLIDGTYKEAESYNTTSGAVSPKARVLFGQILYILCRGPEIITNEKTGFINKIQKRFSDASELKQFGKSSGPIPTLQENWTHPDFATIEQSFGEIPEEINSLLYRYIINRIAGINYCGLNYYNYSMVDGLFSLSLAVSAAGWLARVNAASDSRSNYINEDFVLAIMVIDSNNGYGSALNTGSAGLRLRYLKDHCISIISQYVD